MQNVCCGLPYSVCSLSLSREHEIEPTCFFAVEKKRYGQVLLPLQYVVYVVGVVLTYWRHTLTNTTAHTIINNSVPTYLTYTKYLLLRTIDVHLENDAEHNADIMK